MSKCHIVGNFMSGLINYVAKLLDILRFSLSSDEPFSVFHHNAFSLFFCDDTLQNLGSHHAS